jgi:TRAP-type transport system small permease protein
VTRWIDGCCRGIDYLLAALLAAMVAMVFGNVVLRYGFNAGLTFSEEVSRWAFVWLTFLGALVAVRANAHLGTDMLVGRLGARGRRVCLVLAELGMLACCGLLAWGTVAQIRINLEVQAPVTGWSMAWLPAAGLVFACGAGLLHLRRLGLVAAGAGEADRPAVQASEDVPPAPGNEGAAS